MTASMMGVDPSLSSAGAGHGSMTAETATARNNAPTAISNANIGLLRFQPKAGQTRKSHAGSRKALKRFTAHTAPRGWFPKRETAPTFMISRTSRYNVMQNDLCRWITLMEAMSRASAVALFANEGYSVKGLSRDGLHQAWINLQRRYHEGGQSPDPHKAQLINMAYDVLKREPPSGDDDAREESDTDLPLEEYTVWGWDGEYLTPGFRVECTARQFNKVIRMARERLRRGFIRPLAVLLQPRTTSYDPHLLLIYLNGHSVNPPQRFETEGDPSADRHLKASLSMYNP